MSKITTLTRIQAPEKCYLFEVLLWRAFGRYPEQGIAIGTDEDWRFVPDVRDSMEAPIWDGEELSSEECRFAGIPNDPRMERLLTDLEKEVDLDRQIREAAHYEAALNEWMPIKNEYVDQFKSEICLDLRRGELIAYGTALPDPDYERTEAIVEQRGIWLDDLPIVQISAANWISSDIDWEKSALLGREKSFIWILVSVNEMLKRYPPELLITKGQIVSVGSGFAVASSAIPQTPSVSAGRGRPALPWDKFNVEVARMYRDGEMPAKKEAAIAALQTWFQKALGKPVSRAAIGQKLKPYFDTLRAKDRNS